MSLERLTIYTNASLSSSREFLVMEMPNGELQMIRVGNIDQVTAKATSQWTPSGNKIMRVEIALNSGTLITFGVSEIILDSLVNMLS